MPGDSVCLFHEFGFPTCHHLKIRSVTVAVPGALVRFDAFRLEWSLALQLLQCQYGMSDKRQTNSQTFKTKKK